MDNPCIHTRVVVDSIDMVSRLEATFVCFIPVTKMDPRPIYFGFWCLMTNTTKLDEFACDCFVVQ